MIVRECICTQKLDYIEVKMWTLNIKGGVIIRRQKNDCFVGRTCIEKRVRIFAQLFEDNICDKKKIIG